MTPERIAKLRKHIFFPGSHAKRADRRYVSDNNVLELLDEVKRLQIALEKLGDRAGLETIQNEQLCLLVQEASGLLKLLDRKAQYESVTDWLAKAKEAVK